MRWKDVNLNPNTRVLRDFGVILAVVCVMIAARELWAHHRTFVAVILCIAAVLFASIAAFRPNLLKLIFVASIVVTFPIGWVVSQTILLVLFFGFMTPLALVFRLSGRDPLNLRRVSENDATFWSAKSIDPDKRSYFKQF